MALDSAFKSFLKVSFMVLNGIIFWLRSRKRDRFVFLLISHPTMAFKKIGTSAFFYFFGSRHGALDHHHFLLLRGSYVAIMLSLLHDFFCHLIALCGAPAPPFKLSFASQISFGDSGLGLFYSVSSPDIPARLHQCAQYVPPRTLCYGIP